jgi:lipoprotein NlpD
MVIMVHSRSLGSGKKIALAVCALLLVSALCAAEDFTHIVGDGETFYSISRRYGISVDRLMQINGISDPSRLRKGMKLVLPDMYEVQKGDTFYAIARRLGCDVSVLLTLNNMTVDTVLKPGDRISVPKVQGRQNVAGAQPQAQPAKPQQPPARPVQPASPPPAARPPVSQPSQPQPQQPAQPRPQQLQAQPPQPARAPQPASRPPQPAPPPPAAPRPPAISSSDANVFWPHPGSRKALDGKLEGIAFEGRAGDPVRSVSSGKVAWVGPYRGFGKVVFIQSDQGYIYVYAGQDDILVSLGDMVLRGEKIGTMGMNPYEAKSSLYFIVYKDGKPVKPENAPRA